MECTPFAIIKKKNSFLPLAPKELSDVNDEWIVQHACQLWKMLPGGVNICGIYLVSRSSRDIMTAKNGGLQELTRRIKTQIERDVSECMGKTSLRESSQFLSRARNAKLPIGIAEDMLVLYVDGTNSRLEFES